MSSYKIRFINNSRRSDTSDFTLYSATPVVDSFSGPIQPWSNSFLTKTLPDNGGIWNITINDTPFAACGTSSTKPLQPGTNIDITAVQQATLGSNQHGPGSNHYTKNVGGSPAFEGFEGHSSPVGAYSIQTASDFFPNQNWAGAYALNDGLGSTRPVATFSIDTNSIYTITPPAAPKLFLGAFKTNPGELIDPHVVRLSLGVIDFGNNPGQPNAIVTLDESGIYNVTYMSQAVFAMTAATAVPDSQSSSVQLTQLRHQVKIMADLIDTALGISGPTTAAPGPIVSTGFVSDVGPLQYDPTTPPFIRPDYACMVDWLEGPSEYEKQLITDILTSRMRRQLFFTSKPKIGDQTLTLPVWHMARPPVEFVLAAWIKACAALDPLSLGKYIGNIRVEPMFHTQGDKATTADGPVSATMWPQDPAYVFSLTWLEGPNILTKCSITSKLMAAMRSRGYQPDAPNIDEEKLIIIMSHERPTSLQTATTDWIDAQDVLEFQRMFTTSPECEHAITIASDGSATTQMLPVRRPTYFCSVEWLEGPNPPTQRSIMNKLVTFMAKRNYYPSDPRNNDEKFSCYFTHGYPYDLPTATADWKAAYNSLGSQRMYVTNPQCEFAITIQAGNVSLSELELDGVAAPPDGANGTNGVGKHEPEPIVGAQSAQNGNGLVSAQAQPVAPEVQTSSLVSSESLEEKKRRALALLQREGLVGVGIGVAA